MPDDAFAVEVETGAATTADQPGGDPRPLRFRFGRGTVEVTEILDRWPGADHAYVKLRGSDGATYILRHDRLRGSCQLVLFQRSASPQGTESA